MDLWMQSNSPHYVGLRVSLTFPAADGENLAALTPLLQTYPPLAGG
jgi:hypothetical protein